MAQRPGPFRASALLWLLSWEAVGAGVQLVWGHVARGRGGLSSPSPNPWLCESRTECPSRVDGVPMGTSLALSWGVP